MKIVHPSISPHYYNEKILMAEGRDDEGLDEDDQGLFGDAVADAEEVIDVEDETTAEAGQHRDQEGAQARILPDPGGPIESQREDHRACGHIPYRTWCRHCVEGRSTGEQHRARPGKRSICVFAFDYLYLDAAGQLVKREPQMQMDDVDVTILVAKDTMGKAVFAHVVPQKGLTWNTTPSTP